jgi:hypothetical protein
MREKDQSARLKKEVIALQEKVFSLMQKETDAQKTLKNKLENAFLEIQKKELENKNTKKIYQERERKFLSEALKLRGIIEENKSERRKKERENKKNINLLEDEILNLNKKIRSEKMAAKILIEDIEKKDLIILELRKKLNANFNQ